MKIEPPAPSPLEKLYEPCPQVRLSQDRLPIEVGKVRELYWQLILT
jgi:hypothetical protein